MKLVTVGDSFTYGEELKDRSSAWPQVLANKLGYELLNLGQPSASNDKIQRTLLDYLIDDTADLVIIGWSNIGRSEHADEFGYYDVWPGYQGNLFTRDGTNWRKDLVEYISKYHNSEAIHCKFVQQVLLTQSYLKLNNIKYIMCNIVQNEYYKKKTFDGHLRYHDKVDKERFLGYNQSGMMEWTYGTSQGPNGHFLEEGHQIVAEKINEHIRHLGWLS